MSRLLAALLVLFALPASAKAPKLTLFISVDSMGSDVLLRNRPRLTGGLGRLLSTGAYYPYARYAYAEARTAPGHATLATGANPWRHGIVDNEVYDRATGQVLQAYWDPKQSLLNATTAPGSDTSPVNLMAESLADRLRVSTQGRGKVVALSFKARAAIPLAGRQGQAWWFDESTGRMVTSTWYAKEEPEWMRAFNARKLADAGFGKTWELLRPRTEYVGEDARDVEPEAYGMGRTFPHSLKGGLSAPGPASYRAFAVSPLSHDLLVQAAKAAMEAEHLGQDDVPDILAVSFSGTDAVFHAFGPYSWETQDTLLRLDQAMGELIAAAERAAGGRENLVIALSADHGGAEIPEAWAQAGAPAMRLNPNDVEKGLAQELRAKFGADVTVKMMELDAYLGGKALESGQLDAVAVRRAAAVWLAKQPYVELAVAKDDLAAAPDIEGLVAPLRRGFSPQRSGDVLFVAKPFHVVSDYPRGTNHGTPYSYDTQVPVVFVGRGVKPGVYLEEINPVDVAPTLSALLEMGMPAAAEGKPRAEALTGG
ncbi:alkaline phosphatase family protein [Corallococcus sp. H22C18031201]|uniref:alkaline phosphatase family protein n=1 Tax=Citreicoccus inhibens TaxID=2849499 RepID=UPI000E766DF3|nr:alkaline phosphatase family protein [Citreicoccus inhibens]MBU8895367.1 alkaline phosphatase family protein [Citreicoccus inhibens]RJS22590.1 alkaline phosphatase family protein [Corallococcus sp. H22C18031201]